MKGIRIAGIAARRPDRIVSNDDLAAQGLDTTDEWISSRTGIRTRGIASEEETLVRLATDAASKALAQAGIPGSDVGLVIVATTTMPHTIPGAAPIVASNIGSVGGAFDVGAACAGFSYALSCAADAIRTGSVTTAVVVGADRMSDVVDWSDRSICVLFADGAGAVVLTASDDPADQHGVGTPVYGSDGSGRVIGTNLETGYIFMEGQAVYRWATTALAPVALEACRRAGVEPHELAAFVPHQANMRIIDALAKALDLPEHVVIARDVATAGNTSGATIPLALAALQDAGQLPPGGAVLLMGFGAGLTWSAQVIRIP